MKIELTDPAILRKRLLCQTIGEPEMFEGKVLEVSPSRQYVRFMYKNGDIVWGTFPLIRIIEVLDDKPNFGELSSGS